jgi:hypothetical protein
LGPKVLEAFGNLDRNDREASQGPNQSWTSSSRDHNREEDEFVFTHLFDAMNPFQFCGRGFGPNQSDLQAKFRGGGDESRGYDRKDGQTEAQVRELDRICARSESSLLACSCRK